MNRSYFLFPVLMVAVLTACGGGGGGASAPNDPYQPPAKFGHDVTYGVGS